MEEAADATVHLESPPPYSRESHQTQSDTRTQNPSFTGTSATVGSQYPVMQNFDSMGPNPLSNQRPLPPARVRRRAPDTVEMEPYRTMKRIVGGCITCCSIVIGLSLGFYISSLL